MAGIVDYSAVDLDEYDFSCQACHEPFLSSHELRVHSKSDRHVYNTKRKLNGLKPITHEAWQKKVADTRAGVHMKVQNKGKSHLKPGKEEAQEARKAASAASASVAPSVAPSVAEGSVLEGEALGAGAGDGEEVEGGPALPALPLSPRNSLFDRRHFDSVDKCIAYMEKTHTFFVPDREYCTDLPGLLLFLQRKINEPPHGCLFCGMKFRDAQSVKRHMLDKKHTRIGTEVFSRRGHVDTVGTAEIQEELEEFYDFTASVKEVADRISDPKRQVAAIVRHFDADKDGCLVFKELAALWVAAIAAKEAAPASVGEGEKVEGEAKDDKATAAQPLTEAQYAGACKLVDAEPKQGLDARDLQKLYKAGFADLAEHWNMLIELLSLKRVPRRPVLQTVSEAKEDEKGEDDKDDEDDDDDEEEPEVVEYEDEDEFNEVMQTLGLRAVEFTDTGDLILPDGRTAVHRDMAYIYKQRGERKDEIAIYGGGGGNDKRNVGKTKRALLMLGNSHGCDRVAMSKRQENREGRRIIAVLRRQQIHDMKMGMIESKNMRPRGSGISTTRGDMSYGR